MRLESLPSSGRYLPHQRILMKFKTFQAAEKTQLWRDFSPQPITSKGTNEQHRRRSRSLSHTIRL